MHRSLVAILGASPLMYWFERGKDSTGEVLFTPEEIETFQYELIIGASIENILGDEILPTNLG